MLPKLRKELFPKPASFILILVLLSFILNPLLLAVSNPAHAQQTGQNPVWKFFGRKTTSENYIQVNNGSLQGKDTLRLTFNIYGTCFHPNESTEIIFDQPDGQWHFVQLSNYFQNCYRGKQTVDIPLADFPGLDINRPVGAFHARFWHFNNYRVDVYNALVFNSKDSSIGPVEKYPPQTDTKPAGSSILKSVLPSPTQKPTSSPIPSAIPSPSPLSSPTVSPDPATENTGSWPFQAVSSMKISKDMVCNQPDREFLDRWVKTAKDLGANYIAVETPYEDPYCASALEFTKTWVETIRANGLKIWHRHMPLGFEGIYNTPKTRLSQPVKIITDYITTNSGLFSSEDIFSPIPEPQNGGISGITYCAQNICQFESRESFNSFLRDAMTQSERAFEQAGIRGIKVGFWGFDGFVAWGHNNPDWEGILEDETIKQMGEITIDHYPEAVGTNMAADLDELMEKYPDVPVIIGEWGTITEGDPQEQVRKTMSAARRPGVIGFNYWHMGMGGLESLINEDFTRKIQYDEVREFFRPTAAPEL